MNNILCQNDTLFFQKKALYIFSAWKVHTAHECIKDIMTILGMMDLFILKQKNSKINWNR
jgi:hypothetical protein